jgi:hypothetical protein
MFHDRCWDEIRLDKYSKSDRIIYFCGIIYEPCPDMRFLFAALFLLCVSSVAAQEWRDKVLLLVYSPRYFGPSAFPMPELRSGRSPGSYELEVRGEYHDYAGDRTRDLFVRALLPLIRGRAGLEVRFIPVERFQVTPETRDERHAAALESSQGQLPYNGDVVLSAFYQLLRNERWADAMFSFNLKTASGGRLCDARFTDAATYWVDLTVGRDLFGSRDRRYVLRMQAMAGFSCWMTNSMVLRQNDAMLYGAGLTGQLGPFRLTSDLSGFSGYINNGDHPLQWRNNLQVEYRNNVLSLYYTHGMRDSLYDTYSAGYIRRF